MASTLIPGAHNVEVKIYDDLTTNNPIIAKEAVVGVDNIEVHDWTSKGKAFKPEWLIPKASVPGMEISGMFDDSKFVIRIPDKWNSKLVVSAAGGAASERSMDVLLSDYVLTKLDDEKASYAYASTDKGTRGEIIPAADGKLYSEKRANTAFLHSKDNLAAWHVRMRQLTIAARELLLSLKGKLPIRTYISAGSNGGYVTRYAIEHDGDLYDGGLDWKGVLWTVDINNITVKVDQMRHWKILQDPNASQETKDVAREKYGFPPETDFLMEYYEKNKKLPPDSLRMKFDPTYLHRDWWEYNDHPEDYDDYNWQERPKEVKQAVAQISLTGNIQKPLLSLAGTWDVQIHPFYHAIGYQNLIREKGKGDRHRLYLIEHGNHLDGLVGNPKVDSNNQLQAMLPYFHQAFDILVDWVEKGNPPPASKTIGMPSTRSKAVSIITGEDIEKY
ncbi:tannase/feruloyl esterase family alpha/beta hydrolase [Pelosinus sp. UFO1]|uniref:tannase/feruloyl esterase family alpha/beta hydrolase n=1 Tax=Pelosinus sp. UFO1 TaxID=484770 RepID=UPI0004D1DB85|nr:tannase/feruloyl esterase family alpha/beta hydrolase [Pelosinus sp. UFO1]AIF51141.1 Tannase and feruloyl esterase [Pelosinus sp. UFO1]